jgi:hypothetical protein
MAHGTNGGKGRSQNGWYRDKPFEYYFIYFICSDDKIKPEKPYSIYTPDFGRP